MSTTSSSALEAKIVVLGAAGVGKTSLVMRYCKGSFNPAQTASTVGASFMTKIVKDMDTNTTVRLQIWDTAGQERFRSISRLYYRSANAVILCYSITDRRSFEEMGVWLAELRKNLPSDVVLHFVGTKADLAAQGHREVPFERCIAFVADSLAPGQGGTPPPSAIASSAPPPPFSSAASMLLMQHHYLGASSGSLSGGAPATPGTGVTPLAAAAASLLGRDGAGIAGMEPRSPSSKRSSGFWTQEAGWDACHEVSAESGEGVDEVFGVVTRKLVEQDRRMKQALQAAAATPQYPERFDSGSGGLASGAGAGNRAGGGPAGLTPGGQQVAGDYFAGANPRGSFRVGRDRRSWLFSPGFTPSVSVTGANGDDGGARYGEEVDYAQNRKRCCH